MIITLLGTRGSLACSGAEWMKYGGNTSCVAVQGIDGTMLILDAGTGIRRLAFPDTNKIKRIDILLTHLHLDHIQGLGFFDPLYDPTMEVHIHGPASSTRHLHSLLSRYLSPPLFPVRLNDLPCKLYLHRIFKEVQIGEFHVIGQMICHPGLTYGYRVSSQKGSIAYLPDHEPALGATVFPQEPEWTSGYDLARGVDLLFHDAQYTNAEYETRIGWGHSTIDQAIAFAKLTKAKTLITFHHDPSHTDENLDKILSHAIASNQMPLKIIAGREDEVFKFL